MAKSDKSPYEELEQKVETLLQVNKELISILKFGNTVYSDGHTHGLLDVEDRRDLLKIEKKLKELMK